MQTAQSNLLPQNTSGVINTHLLFLMALFKQIKTSLRKMIFSMLDLLLYTEDLSNGWQPRLRAHRSGALVSMGLKDKKATMSCCFDETCPCSLG